jgi:two-component system cell cycle response regulator
MVRALDIGVNDYLMRPVERSELLARARTQLRRKRYSDRLRHSLQLSLEMAITDQLTGLFNRRYMSRHLNTLMADGGKPVSFLILDVDFFKQINDTYGHDVGDEVLREFAGRISANVRGIDLACRFGGEEFVVVMPDTDLSFAYMVAERLRQSVADAPFQLAGNGKEVPVTISIGVATSYAGDTPEVLLKRADQALYRAKRDGRNRVIADAA